MRFSSILIASLSLFALTSATLVKVPQGHHSQLAARVTPYADKVVKTLEDLTKQSREIDPLAQALKTGPEGVIAFGQFNPVIRALNEFVTAITSDIANMGSPTFAAAGQTKICSAYKVLASQHETLLDILISKADPLSGVTNGPVHATLKRDESALDSLSFQIVDSVPTCANKVKADKVTLDKKLAKAICAYTPLGTQLTFADLELCQAY